MPIKWYLEIQSVLWELKCAHYMLQDNLLFFVVELDLYHQKGTLWTNRDVFVFRCEDTYPMEKLYNMKSYKMVNTVHTPLPLAQVDMKSSSFLQNLADYLQVFLRWSLYRNRCTVYGPVSFVSLENSDARQVVLLGDIHDDLAVPGVATAQQVSDMWSAFFGSAQDFFSTQQQQPSFERFKFMVNKMKLLFYDTNMHGQHHLTLYIWEFLVLLMHNFASNNNDDVDIIVEDPQHMAYESIAVHTYLDAVRYLFSLCATVRKDDPNSPFASFVPECKQLFPSVQYHRIDLRFGVFEEPIGNFDNDELLPVIGSLSSAILQARRSSSSSLDRLTFTILLRTVHHTNNTQDENMLYHEFRTMLRALAKTELWTNYDMFLEVFMKAVQTHWVVVQPSMTRSRWFLFRTCVTDLYGLAKTLGSKNTKALVYIGDYHAKVWRDVLVYFSHYRIVQEQYPGAQRTLEFREFQEKPLMDGAVMEQQQTHTLAAVGNPDKLRLHMQFFNLLDDASMRRLCVPFLATQMKDNVLFAKHIMPFLPSSVQTLYMSSARALMRSRTRIQQDCNSGEDGLLNEFEDMNEQDIETVYKQQRTGTCFSADAMYRWWQTSAAEGRVLRDPITRRFIDQEERDVILARSPSFLPLPPQRRTNPPNWNVVVEKTINNTNKREREIYAVWLQTSSSSSFFVCYVYCQEECSNDEVVEILASLEETLKHSPLLLENNKVFHDSIHFDAFRNLTRWFHHPKQTLQQLKSELTPFSSNILW